MYLNFKALKEKLNFMIVYILFIFLSVWVVCCGCCHLHYFDSVAHAAAHDHDAELTEALMSVRMQYDWL